MSGEALRCSGCGRVDRTVLINPQGLCLACALKASLEKSDDEG